MQLVVVAVLVLFPRPVLRERAGVRALVQVAKDPHPNPLPEYRARRGIPAPPQSSATTAGIAICRNYWRMARQMNNMVNWLIRC